MDHSADYLHDVFADFGPITLLRMFGGHGIYHQGLMFALLADSRLYLKTDATNLAQFQAAGCEPFTFTARGKAVQLSYWSAPEAMLDERDQAVHWGRSAFAAAVRAQAAKAKSAPQTKTKATPARKTAPGKKTGR